jgi:hypothetical protein
MTVVSQVSEYTATGNGSLTVFASGIYLLDTATLDVKLRTITTGAEVTQVLGSDFTLSAVGVATGVIVTFIVAPPSTKQIAVSRNIPYTQQLDISNQSAYYPAAIEDALDTQEMQTQQIAAKMGRAMLAPVGETIGVMPKASLRANTVTLFDASGNPTVGPTAAAISAAQANADRAQSYADLSTKTIFADGIAEMKAILKASLTTGQPCIVSGYTNAVKKGGGRFIWVAASTATVDLGMVFAANEGGTGRWLRQVEGALNFYMFGAKGDGTTNDYASLQGAIDAAIGQYELVVPVGTFKTATSLRVKSATGLVMRGENREQSIIKRNGNSGGALLQSRGGDGNRFQDFTLDCAGYDGRGIFVLDRFSIVDGLRVLECPDRAYGLNGGENNFYGVTTFDIPSVTISAISKANPAVVTTATAHGYTTGNSVTISGGEMTQIVDRRFVVTVINPTSFSLQEDGVNVNSTAYTTYVSGGTVTLIDFFPMGCKIVNSYAYRSARTAFSAKRMRYAEISSNYAEKVYSEGATLDKCDWSMLTNNTFIDVARTDRSTTWPDLVNGGQLMAGDVGGGVGGAGIDGSNYCKITGNTWQGLQEDVPLITNRWKAGINFPNNIAGALGNIVSGNSIQDAKMGIKLTGIADGGVGNCFKFSITDNSFQNIADSETRGSGVDLGLFGDLYLGEGGGHIVTGNRRVGGVLTAQDTSTDSSVWFEDAYLVRNGATNVALAGALTAGVGTYTAQRMTWTKVGRVVHFTIHLIWTAHTGTGQFLITGLPYLSGNFAGNITAISCSVTDLAITGQLCGHIQQNESQITLFVVNNGVRSNYNVEAAGTITIAGSYQTAK